MKDEQATKQKNLLRRISNGVLIFAIILLCFGLVASAYIVYMINCNGCGNDDEQSRRATVTAILATNTAVRQLIDATETARVATGDARQTAQYMTHTAEYHRISATETAHAPGTPPH